MGNQGRQGEIRKNPVGGLLANLSRERVIKACGGDHRTALLVAQVVGGGEVIRMVQQVDGV